MRLTSRLYLAIIITAITVFSSMTLLAEKVIKAEGYKIHYNAFNSSMLTPEIAKQYEIQRSKSLGILNISVLKDLGDSSDSIEAVTAFIEGHAKNSISQMKELNFKKVTEGHAIYYIATFNFAENESLTFNFYVVPKGETTSTKVSFKQQFFVE